MMKIKIHDFGITGKKKTKKQVKWCEEQQEN